MAEIWELSPEDRERAETLGYSQAQIEAYEQTRRANWLAIKADIQGDMTDDEFKNYYRRKYGIEHECRCAEDRYEGNIETRPSCMLHFHDQIVDKLEEVLPERDYLLAAVDDLRMQIAELGATPRS